MADLICAACERDLTTGGLNYSETKVTHYNSYHIPFTYKALLLCAVCTGLVHVELSNIIRKLSNGSVTDDGTN